MTAKTTLKNYLFYSIKPMVPRSIQLSIRRYIAGKKRKKYAHVWPINEGAGAPPPGWKGWPEGKTFALVLQHDVDTKIGHDKVSRLMDLEEGLGVRSTFFIVPERYPVSPRLLEEIKTRGFGLGVHGLKHDGKLFKSYEIFKKSAVCINQYLRAWNVSGYSSPSMLRNLEWMHHLDIKYSTSTFDTDPFEPEPDAEDTIFPFVVKDQASGESFIELPYTLPQDFTLFIILKEKNIAIWEKKLEWVARHGGMALLNTHPDYMDFTNGKKRRKEEYPVRLYEQFVTMAKNRYSGQFWSALSKEVAAHYLSGGSSEQVREHQRSLALKQRCEPYSTKGHRMGEKKERPLRACMVSYSFYDSDVRVRRYAEALMAEGWDLEIISLRSPGQSKFASVNGAKVFRIQKREKNEKGKLSYLLRIVWFFIQSFCILTFRHFKAPFALIHVHSVPDFEVFSAFIPKLAGARVVLDIHDIVPEFYASKFTKGKMSPVFSALVLIEKLCCAFADHVIIANDIWLKKITSRSVSEDKCTAIINYPVVSIFHGNWQKQLNDKLIIVYPGTIAWHQGLDLAVEALYARKADLPDFEFHIYGGGPEQDSLIALIQKSGMERYIQVKKVLPMEQIAEKMFNADLAIVPKRADSFGNEAFSTKIMEFMALGVPVIAARTQVDQLYFNDNLVCFFDPGNIDDLGEKIVFLANNKKARMDLSLKALKFIEENTWEKKKYDYLKIVDRLISPPNAKA